MLNYQRYKRVPVVDFPERTWPNKEIMKAPIWCSVDLRDGNQALVEPMVVEEKVEMFNLLVKLGFKEIEVGFPAASQIEYDFLRTLVERRLIPDDVEVQVLVQCREHLIRRTFEALDGVKKAIVHIYNSTSTLQRDVVFHKDMEEIKDIAVLTRVGRPTCFVITGTEVDENGEEVFLLSRSLAQRLCRRQYLDTLEAGSVIPCTVTHIENFGAFCDIGCGIAALLPIDCLSVSRISSPADRVQVGQQLLCAIKNRDAQGRFVLTIRELLGTWAENAARFTVGETVVGIVRSVEEYGTFVEIAPNLAGLAESCSGLAPGQAVSVYIKNILPEKMKIKLVIVNHALSQPHRFELRYFITEGHLDRWVYSTPECPKRIETDFAVAACNPG